MKWLQAAESEGGLGAAEADSPDASPSQPQTVVPAAASAARAVEEEVVKK